MNDMTLIVEAFTALFIVGCAIATTGLLLFHKWLRSREFAEQDEEDD